MDASLIANLGLLGVTAIGVLVAIYQAKEARSARDEAETARDQAEGHEKAALAAAERSASAADRTATALEERTLLARDDRLDEERRERARAAEAMIAYAEARADGIATDERISMSAAVAGARFPMSDARRWVIDAAEQLREAARVVRTSPTDQWGEPMPSRQHWYQYQDYRNRIIDRLHEWVSDGVLDETPLPTIPSFDAGSSP